MMLHKFAVNLQWFNLFFYLTGDYDPGCWAEVRGVYGDYNCDAPEALILSATRFLRDFDSALFGLSIGKGFQGVA
jgi:hypothetical protein